MTENRICRSHDVFATSLDDTVIMMSVTRGRYYGLNEAGSRIWELLEKETTEATVVEQLLAEYDVVREVCTEAVRAFLTQLRERDLLVDVA